MEDNKTEYPLTPLSCSRFCSLGIGIVCDGGKIVESGVPFVLLKLLIDAVANQIGRGDQIQIGNCDLNMITKSDRKPFWGCSADQISACLGLFLSHNTIHSTSRILFIWSAEQPLWLEELWFTLTPRWCLWNTSDDAGQEFLSTRFTEGKPKKKKKHICHLLT